MGQQRRYIHADPYQERYRKQLIASGLSEADAMKVAARTVTPPAQGPARPPASAAPASQAQAKPTPAPVPAKAAPEAASPPPPVRKRLRRWSSLRLQRPRKARRPQLPPAANPRTRKTWPKIAQGEQLSLFEIAPWSDDQRGMPNDLARTAIFSARNHKTPARISCASRFSRFKRTWF
jgi:hypothetical protein